MKYKNASDVLPNDLVEELQKYVQGEFLYIPIKERKKHKAVTEYKIELEKRNNRLYKMHLEGMSNEQLAKNFSLAQSSVRRIIVSQRRRFEAMSEIIKNLLPCWNLQNEKAKQIYGTVWQIGEDYVLKTYSDIKSLKRNILINSHLESMGIPVTKVLSTTDGKLFVEKENQFFFVSTKLSGSNIVNLKFSSKIALTMGEIIAKLHIAFDSLEDKLELWDNSFLDEMNGWVKDSFEESGWQNIEKGEYEQVVNNFEKSYDKLPVGLIHRDVHFGNFLFNNGEFSGYIDFDLSQKNIRIFDLCYFVLSVLSEQEKFQIEREKWFDFVKKVFAGYNKILPLKLIEKESAVYVMECIELLFLAFFDGQQDVTLAKSTYAVFEFIKSNERRITKAIS